MELALDRYNGGHAFATRRVRSTKPNRIRTNICMVDKESTQENIQYKFKTARNIWQKTHKYGLRIPHLVKEAIETDKENWDTLWWDYILQKMKNVQPAFKAY